MRVGEALRLDRGDIDCRRRGAGGPRLEVRQVPSGAAAAQHGGRARALRPPPRPALPAPRAPQLLRLAARHPRHLRVRLADASASCAPRPPGSAPARRSARGSTTSATPSRCARCSTGIATATTSRRRLPWLSTYLGHREPRYTYWYLSAAPELLALRRPPARRRQAVSADDARRPDAAGVLHRPPRPAAAGQPAHHRLLPRHAPTAARLRPRHAPASSPSTLDWDDLDATARSPRSSTTSRPTGTTAPRTRNLRLTAIRSLFNYAALRHPEHAALIQRVLAIPPKRFDKRDRHVPHRSRGRRPLDAPDRSTLGRPPRPRPARRSPSRPACASPS